MSPLLKSKLTLVTAVYWILLSYMVAALLFWFIALNKQNRIITNIRLNELKHDDPNYYRDALSIENAASRKTIQFISEGSTFLY